MKKPSFSLNNRTRSAGERSPTRATGAIRVDKGAGWSVRKKDVVLRILRGETLDALGQELTVSPAKLASSKEPVAG